MASPIVVVGASRPHPAETENGDGWAVASLGPVCRVAVVDALGHGPDAAAVARLALAAIGEVPEASPVESLHVCHAALIGSRGAAVGIATIDTERGAASYAGVGNVEARLWGGTEYHGYISFRGIVGYRLPTSLRATEQPLRDDWLLFVYSDGMRTQAIPSDRPARQGREPQAVVDSLIVAGAREHDDATIVAAWATS
ncbi:MAG: SpoIIE family protein phosphatase [Chloroflexota bacterium]